MNYRKDDADGGIVLMGTPIDRALVAVIANDIDAELASDFAVDGNTLGHTELRDAFGERWWRVVEFASSYGVFTASDWQKLGEIYGAQPAAMLEKFDVAGRALNENERIDKNVKMLSRAVVWACSHVMPKNSLLDEVMKSNAITSAVHSSLIAAAMHSSSEDVLYAGEWLNIYDGLSASYNEVWGDARARLARSSFGAVLRGESV